MSRSGDSAAQKELFQPDTIEKAEARLAELGGAGPVQRRALEKLRIEASGENTAKAYAQAAKCLSEAAVGVAAIGAAPVAEAAAEAVPESAAPAEKALKVSFVRDEAGRITHAVIE